VHRAVLALALASAACGSAENVEPGASAPRSSASVLLSGAALAAGSASAPAAAAPSTPLLEAPAGALYGFVRERGVFRLAPEPALVIPNQSRSIEAMAIGPDGSVWASFFEGGTFRFSDGKLENVSRDTYQDFAFGASGEPWAVTDEIEWHVDRFDGKRFVRSRKRTELSGPFDDNKFEDLALTKDAVWVACWNGLFRHAGRTWDKVATPDPNDRPWQLASDGERLYVRFPDSGWHATTDGRSFEQLGWSAEATIAAENAAGQLAGRLHAAAPTVVLGAADGRGARTSDPLPASDIDDIDVDARGRTWVATDFALVVLDRDGGVLRSWAPGTFPGTSGMIEALAVQAGGPETLPAAAEAEAWEVRGAVQIYKSSNPLVGATVSICPSPLGCKGAPFSRATTTEQDGTFRFRDVPPADFWIHIDVPAGTPDCGGVFTAGDGGFVSIAACKPAQAGARVCDVRTLQVCLPFEMPPPR
jgi:hypothetical protein